MSRSRYCRCGSPLARDNTDALCSVCRGKQRRDRAPEVPAEFWHSALMGAALASGNLGRVIRMYRFHPFHRQPLPQSVVAGWLYVSQATLSRIERGTRHLTIDEIDSFTRALGMPVALRWTAHHEAEEDVDPLSRRSLLGAGAGAAFGLSATTAPAAAREINPELVSHWTRLRSVLARHDAMFGPHEVLGTVRHELDLIAEHRQIARGDLRTQLLREESRWAEFASWLSNDAGDLRGRDSWADRALRLAHEANYDDMVAWVLLRRSRRAVQEDDPRRAITFAEAARRTPGASDLIRGLCALKEAQGHALANDTASCERSLAAADGLLDPRDITAETPWDDMASQDATVPYVLAAEARCWLWLAPRKAVTMFEDVVRSLPHDRTRSRGIQHARVAQACAAANEPDRAAAEGIKALEIARVTKSDLTVRELKRLDHQLAGCDLPAAAEFREAFAAL